MTRIQAGLMGIAAVVALTAGAAKAQAYYDTSYDPDGAYTTGEVTVYAPRVYHDQSRVGSPEEIVRESRLVRADDLDLAAAGMGLRPCPCGCASSTPPAMPAASLATRYMAVDSDLLTASGSPFG